jgi:excisionase family DNA binding protein
MTDPANLTIRDAATLLNVSLAFVVDLLDSHQLGCHVIGGDRFIARNELLRFKEEKLQQQHAAIFELQAEVQKLNLGY